MVKASKGRGAAAAAAALPELTGTSIIDDNRLRLICVAGSLGGAVISIMLFATGSHKELARKLTVSALAGILLTPMLLRYLTWTSQTDAILAVSAIVAMLSWSVLQTVVPMLSRMVVKWAGGLAPKDPKPPAN